MDNERYPDYPVNERSRTSQPRSGSGSGGASSGAGRSGSSSGRTYQDGTPYTRPSAPRSTYDGYERPAPSGRSTSANQGGYYDRSASQGRSASPSNRSAAPSSRSAAPSSRSSSSAGQYQGYERSSSSQPRSSAQGSSAWRKPLRFRIRFRQRTASSGLRRAALP
ncbi:MAG: hypothetical protein R2912_10980 [Eubacteriales bacterium]